ncbi:hypothetical protein BH20VER3_BH20VER3_12100 [soil metagenome]
MESELPGVLIVAGNGGHRPSLGGISLLERQLRIFQRLGFRHATICSDSIETVRNHLSRSSWARAGVTLKFQARPGGAVTIEEVRQALPATGRLLFCPEAYCDGRLWRALAQKTATTLLIESDPPAISAPLWEGLRRHAFGLSSGIALLEKSWLTHLEPDSFLAAQLTQSAAAAHIGVLDAAREPAYVVGQRREVRPIWFPAPHPKRYRLAESALQNGIQNGVLDLPALVHAPIETWIVRQICRTSIRPNQITLVTLLIGLAVTALLATGHLWLGTALALVVGVLDGVDGKLARLKVETTELGQREHALDYAIELSCWTALAYHFSRHGLGSSSWVFWLLLVVSDLIARAAKRTTKKITGRNLDDVAAVDRFFRLVAGRRNIYIWIFAAGMIVGFPVAAFELLCSWGVVTALAHVIRAAQIRGRARNVSVGRDGARPSNGRTSAGFDRGL